MTNSLGFYNYLVFLHFEGRIIDIYTRVTAPRKYFFVPLDNEVSARYFTWVVTKVKLANKKYERAGGLVGQKKFSITYNKVTETVKDYKRKVNHIVIYRRNAQGTMVLYRHFVKTDDGTICELEEGVPFAVDEHPLLERWPEVKRKLQIKNPTEVEEKKDEGEGGAYNIAMDADSDIEFKEERQD